MEKTETPIEATDIIIDHDTFISGYDLVGITYKGELVAIDHVYRGDN